MKKILFISIFTALFITASCESNENNNRIINDNEKVYSNRELNVPPTVAIKEIPTKAPLKESLVKKAEKITEKVQIEKPIIPTPGRSFKIISTPIRLSFAIISEIL